MAARQGMVQAIVSLEPQQAVLPAAGGLLAAAVAALRTRVQALDAQIATRTKAGSLLPTAQVLRSVPGIGPVTATAPATCFAAHRFPTADAFVAYVGRAAVRYEADVIWGNGNS